MLSEEIFFFAVHFAEFKPASEKLLIVFVTIALVWSLNNRALPSHFFLTFTESPFGGIMFVVEGLKLLELTMLTSIRYRILNWRFCSARANKGSVNRP